MMSNETEVKKLKYELEKFTSYGYPCIFLTSQWDRLVELIGDEAATEWYKTVDYCEDGI